MLAEKLKQLGNSVYEINKNWRLSAKGKQQMQKRIQEVQSVPHRMESMEQIMNIGGPPRQKEKERVPQRRGRQTMQQWR